MVRLNSGEQAMGPLERGRRRYEAKEYQQALAPFTEAVNMSTGHLLLSALDHRAAAYEKLKQFQPALRDAKKMIDLKPEISKGYLRCGKILQLKGEDDLATKIYERGLKKVKIGTDDDRVMLQKMYNKMKRAQDPSKSLDPLQFLPLELAEMICHNLSMRDRVICLAVSKPWRRLLESSHKLWTNLDTTSSKKTLSFNSLKAYLKRSNYSLNAAVLTMRNMDATRMIYLTKNCKNLKHLEIRGAGIVGASLISSLPFAKKLENLLISKNTTIGISAAQDAIKPCRETLLQVKFLQVKGSRMAGSGSWPIMPKLTELCLKADGDYFLDIPELVKAAPSIESVTLSGWQLRNLQVLPEWTNLEDLDLTNTNITSLPKLPPTLQRLILRDNRHLTDGSLEEGEYTLLPLLETFDCAGTSLTGPWIHIMLTSSIKQGKLRNLSIGDRIISMTGSSFADSTAWEREVPPCKTLQELSLAGLVLSESGLINAVKLYPNLRILDVSSTAVTGVAIKHFVKQGIEYLKLNECSALSTDAVDWARGRGVQVEFNFPSRSKGVKGYREAYAY